MASKDKESIEEGIGRIIKKWYAPDSPHSEDGYGESCEHEIVVYLHNNDIVRKVDKTYIYIL